MLPGSSVYTHSYANQAYNNNTKASSKHTLIFCKIHTHLHNSFTLSHLYVSTQITILFVLFVKTLGLKESPLAQCKRMASLPSGSGAHTWPVLD